MLFLKIFLHCKESLCPSADYVYVKVNGEGGERAAQGEGKTYSS